MTTSNQAKSDYENLTKGEQILQAVFLIAFYGVIGYCLFRYGTLGPVCNLIFLGGLIDIVRSYYERYGLSTKTQVN